MSARRSPTLMTRSLRAMMTSLPPSPTRMPRSPRTGTMRTMVRCLSCLWWCAAIACLILADGPACGMPAGCYEAEKHLLLPSTAV